MSLWAGHYHVAYTGNVAGSYSLALTLNGEPIHASPFNLALMSADTDPAMCDLHGVGLNGSVAGVGAEFTITARDQFGNQREQGGETDKFSVNMSTEAHFYMLDLTDNQDGTYTASYKLDKADTYTITVLPFVHPYDPNSLNHPCRWNMTTQRSKVLHKPLW